MLYKLILLRDEVEEELGNILQLQGNLQDMQDRMLDPEIEKRVFASVLFDYYMAMERIFKMISKEIDGKLPSGEGWHKKLLRQMSVELPETRPAVIDKRLYCSLEEYLKFRHLVRNIYGFQLKYERFAHLIDQMDATTTAVEYQVSNFFNTMEHIARQLED